MIFDCPACRKPQKLILRMMTTVTAEPISIEADGYPSVYSEHTKTRKIWYVCDQSNAHTYSTTEITAFNPRKA